MNEPRRAPAEGAEPTPSEEKKALFTPEEARVLGCLMEKQRTTPDYYPLTLRAVMTACNQQTSRDPVMHLELGAVGALVNALRDREWIRARQDSRAEKYDHQAARRFDLDRKEQAALCVLMLRGPQTSAEIRTNTRRMATFEDLAELEATLELLIERDPPLAVKLPPMPGQRGVRRYAHLLCGAPTIPAATPAPPAAADRIARLEAGIAELRQRIERLEAAR